MKKLQELLNNLKKKLNNTMNRIRKENPNANWRNLITGIVILVLLGVFSTWYLSSDQTDGLFNDANLDSNNSLIFEDNNSDADNSGVTTVQAGEGLWQVAERVCGRSEAYVYLAEANNMSVWWAPLVVDQELIVDCGPAE
jgi:hypothetical protein